MKRKSVQKALAILLTITMLAGQFMVSTALAADEIILGDSSENVISDGTPATPAPTDAAQPTPASTADGAPDSGSAVPAGTPTPSMITGGAFDRTLLGAEDAILFAEPAPNGGLSISVTSSQTSVKDGDLYTFTVAIADSDLTTEPNINPGDRLTIKLPEFLSAADMDAALKNCFAYFERDYTYDPDAHTLTLTFKENGEGTWANIQFSISLMVDTIGYDGDGKGQIDVGIGNVVKSDVDVDVGTGTGEGEGEGQIEPYVEKNIWSNYKNSEYGVEGSYVMRDPDAPIGYAVSFGVNSNYTNSVSLIDNLSNGALTLCDANGNRDASLAQCVNVFIEGVKQTGSASGNTVTYSGTAVGTVIITRGETGFAVTCTNPAASEDPARIVNLVVRYYAMVTGSTNDLTNTVSMAIDGRTIGSSQETIRRYDNQGLVINKRVLSGGQGMDVIDIDDAQVDVTFRLVLTQYGTGSLYQDGDVINFDMLAGCFRFQSGSVVIPEGAPFRLEADPDDAQKINIIKSGDGPIASGVYTIDFTVSIDAKKLQPGEQAENSVGNTVRIRRKAKLIIDKTWTGEKDRGAGAVFELLDGSNVIARSIYAAGNQFVLYLSADSLHDGEYSYTLRETVDENSEYIAAKNRTVAIRKDSGKVTIVSIDGVPYAEPSGIAVVPVENVPDSGKGSLTFKKYGDSVSDDNLLDGGVYQLWKVGADGATDTLIETFSTVNGVKIWNDLVYGTYYVKEISAPAGYLVPVADATDGVQLKKTEPHQTISLVNERFDDGKITIRKVDENGAALAGVTFTLTPAAGESVSAVTDRNGIATFSGLVAGTYSVTETVPFGYSGFAGSVLVTIDTATSSANVEGAAGVVAASDGTNMTLTWTNVRQYGTIRITKWNPSMQTRLAGAVFELSGNGIETKQATTDEDGVAEFIDLPFGSYLLKETAAPEGYVISEALQAGVSVTVNAAGVVHYTYINETQKGSIEISKTTGESGAPLAGATFGLYSDAEATRLLTAQTTDSSGLARFANLEKGVYYVKETAAPTGYQLDTNIYEFAVGGGEPAVWDHVKTIVNDLKRYRLAILKTDETGSRPLSGAAFRLTGNGVDTTGVSDESGWVYFADLPYGTYTVTETQAPSGYALAKPITVTIDDSNTYRPDFVVAVSEPIKNVHTRLTVLKWNGSGDVPLPGAVFRIRNAEQQYVLATGADGAYTYTGLADDGDSATRFVTAGSGAFTIDYIPMGQYTLEEIEAPDGYIILTDSVEFGIQEAETSVSINNTRIQAVLRLVKADENGMRLPNVGFRLRNSAGGYVMADGTTGAYTYTGLTDDAAAAALLVTDELGEVALTGLLWGTYYLDEVATPDGLVPQSGVRVDVTAEQHNATIKVDVVNDIELGSIRFKKTDALGNGLSGAVFKLELVAGSGNAYSDTQARFAVSDSEGIVRFERIPYGVYRITEYLAPAGFELSGAVRYVRIGDAPVPEGVEITAAEELGSDWLNDTTVREFTVRKVSSTDGAVLTGAVFEVLDRDQQRIGADGLFLTINEHGSDSVTLPLGVYYLKEIQAPENYVLEETPIRFAVTAEGPNEIVVRNVPSTGSLTILKTDAADGVTGLSGAEFRVYEKTDYIQNGANARVVAALTTNADGRATLTNIPFGSYAVVETKAPDGFELSGRVQYFTITNAASGEPNAGERITLSFANERSRYLLGITKVDKLTGQTLAGARFAVSGNGFYAETVTGADGTAVVQVPAAGVYSVLEIAAPIGYTIDPNTYTVEVTGHTAEGVIPAAQFVSEDYSTAVRIVKVDETGANLDGATFVLYSLLGETEHAVLLTETAEGVYRYAGTGTATRIAAGSVEILGLPAGDYLLREQQAPDGYMALGDVRFTVDVGLYDQALTLTVENIPHQKGVAICKENADGVRLQGAVFDLYAAGGAEPIQTATTSAAGYAVFSNLRTGSYVIREKAAPEGYQLSDAEYAFTIDGTGRLVSEHGFVQIPSVAEPFFVLVVKNEPIEQGFRIRKLSAANDTLVLAGAQFRILGNGVNRTFVTGADGLTETIFLPIGSYTLTEQKAPAGYVTGITGSALEVREDGVYVDGEKLLGEVMTYTVKNQPQSFYLRILKQDQDSKQPLSGVAFHVVGADGQKHALLTDENGLTASIALAPGIYAVSEVVAAAGYNLPLAGWSFTVTEGAAMQVVSVENAAKYTFEDGLLTLVLENEKTSGSLLINKFDADDSTPLQGARFEVLDRSGSRIRFTLVNGVYSVSDAADALEQLETNAMGTALLQNLPFGTYIVREVFAPVGYAVSTTDTTIRIISQDETAVVSVPNRKILHDVTVYKRSAGEDGHALMGATFALYSVVGDTKTFLYEATTGYDGKARFTLPYGSYVIVETRAPEGYELSGGEPVEFTIDADTPDGAEFSFTFTNEQSRYALAILKYDADDPGKVLAGAEFAVTDSRGFTKVVTTGADGRAVLADLVYDDYTIREIRAPEGYYLNEQIYRVERSELLHGKTVEVKVPDTYILGSVTLRKVDHEDPTKVLEGAEFILMDAADSALRWDVSDGIYTLNPEGETETITAGTVTLQNLPAGQYTLKETKAPAGYVSLDEARKFSITADNAAAALEISIENMQRRTAVGITKIDEENHELRLRGAEFTLYRLENGQPTEKLATTVTNENGLATFTDLTMGTYRLMETLAPEGYQLWRNPIDFVVDETGAVKVGSGGLEIPEVDQVFVFSVTNRSIKQEITIRKISAETGAALPGATFRLTGNEVYDVTTGPDGTASITLPYGRYFLQELVAPDGYMLDQTLHTVQIDGEGVQLDGERRQDLVITLQNDPVAYCFILHKQDAATGKPLAGVVFTLSGLNRSETLTTDASGNTAPIRITPGTYTISETKAPNGYKKPLSGWTLVVGTDGKMTISGSGASIVSGCSGAIVTIENTKTPTSPGVGATGETGNNGQLLAGAILMLCSFVGLLWLALHDKRRGHTRSL